MAKDLAILPTQPIQQASLKFSVNYGRVADVPVAFRNVNPIPRHGTMYLRR
jgi:hypothetical protein